MPETTDYQALAEQIRSLASQLGFQQLGISAPDIGQHEQWLEQWLQQHHTLIVLLVATTTILFHLSIANTTNNFDNHQMSF